MTDEEVEMVMSEIDSSGDGDINMDEFIAWWEIHAVSHQENDEPKEAISAHSWKTRTADVLDATMSYNEVYSMFETCHTKDADFNAQKLAKLWAAITMDTEVVITPHPLNVETEMTLVEFTELLTRVALIKTKSLKKKLSPGARVEEFMHEFFLVCNQNMPVAGKYLEKAEPLPFVTSCFQS